MKMTISHFTLKRVFLSALIAVVFVITVTSLYLFNNEKLHRGITKEMELETTTFFNSNQEDEKLVQDLRSKIVPPAFNAHPNMDGFDFSHGQGSAVRKLTHYKTHGSFIECGCGDGQYLSNTFFLENYMSWTGLLIEADPDNVKAILKLKRKAWVAPFCMSHNTSAYETTFTKAAFPASVLPYSSFKVRCYPFFTYLLALNMTQVDYLSLDVEGEEVQVLGTIPFDKVDFTVLSVRFSKSQEGLLGIKNIMEEAGYKVVLELPPDYLFFVKKDYPSGLL